VRARLAHLREAVASAAAIAGRDLTMLAEAELIFAVADRRLAALVTPPRWPRRAPGAAHAYSAQGR